MTLFAFQHTKPPLKRSLHVLLKCKIFASRRAKGFLLELDLFSDGDEKNFEIVASPLSVSHAVVTLNIGTGRHEQYLIRVYTVHASSTILDTSIGNKISNFIKNHGKELSCPNT